jgi:hypothetical protein
VKGWWYRIAIAALLRDGFVQLQQDLPVLCGGESHPSDLSTMVERARSTGEGPLGIPRQSAICHGQPRARMVLSQRTALSSDYVRRSPMRKAVPDSGSFVTKAQFCLFPLPPQSVCGANMSTCQHVGGRIFRFGGGGSCVSSNEPLKRIARGGDQLRRPAADPHTIGRERVGKPGGRVPQAGGGFRTEDDFRGSRPSRQSLSRAICSAPGAIGVPLVQSTRALLAPMS